MLLQILIFITFIEVLCIFIGHNKDKEGLMAASLITFVLTIFIGWILLGICFPVSYKTSDIKNSDIEIIKGRNIMYLYYLPEEKTVIVDSHKDYLLINDSTTKFKFVESFNMYGSRNENKIEWSNN